MTEANALDVSGSAYCRRRGARNDVHGHRHRSDVVKVREVVRDMEGHGWYVNRHRCSHRVMCHSDHADRLVVVAGNEGTTCFLAPRQLSTGRLASTRRPAAEGP